MSSLSTLSKSKLNSCHSELQRLINAVAETENIAVICGYRGRYEQEEAYRKGNSRAKFGQSKHNLKPAEAVDVVPMPLNWDDIPAFDRLGEIIMKKAEELGIKIRWGKYFKGLADYAHFELV